MGPPQPDPAGPNDPVTVTAKPTGADDGLTVMVADDGLTVMVAGDVAASASGAPTVTPTTEPNPPTRTAATTHRTRCRTRMEHW